MGVLIRAEGNVAVSDEDVPFNGWNCLNCDILQMLFEGEEIEDSGDSPDCPRCGEPTGLVLMVEQGGRLPVAIDDDDLDDYLHYGFDPPRYVFDAAEVER